MAGTVVGVAVWRRRRSGDDSHLLSCSAASDAAEGRGWSGLQRCGAAAEWLAQAQAGGRQQGLEESEMRIYARGEMAGGEAVPPL